MKNVLFSLLVLSLFIDIAHPEVSATIKGDTVKIWDTGFSWSCSGRFFSLTRISNDTVYATECDTMRLVTCLCYYDFCTNLTGLNPGTYTAVVMRRHEEHIYIPQDTIYVFTESAGSVKFTINTPPLLSPKTSFQQSACRNTPQFVSEDKSIPNDYAMLTNYPNPFNPSTTIYYTISKSSHVNLAIYNMLGQQIVILVNENKHAGSHKIAYNSQNISSGIYICQLTIDERILSVKMILLK